MAAGAELDSLPTAPMPADAEQPKPCGSTPGEPEKENMVFFSQNNNPFSSSGGLYAQRSLLTGVYFANTSCSVMVFTPAEEPKSWIVLPFL